MYFFVHNIGIIIINKNSLIEYLTSNYIKKRTKYYTYILII